MDIIEDSDIYISDIYNDFVEIEQRIPMLLICDDRDIKVTNFNNNVCTEGSIDAGLQSKDMI